MTRILRVETKNGIGPFSSKIIPYSKLAKAFCMPNPYDDGIYDFQPIRHKCAFVDIDQFLDVFYAQAELQALAEYGFGLSEYEVDDHYVIHGRSQSVYNWKKAKKLCWIPLEELI